MKIRKYLIIAGVLATIFATLGASQSMNAKDISADDFMPRAFESYQNLMANANMAEDESYLSDAIIQLVEERQSFYQKYFTDGLHSDLVKIESEFDQTSMKVISSGEIEVSEIVNLTGISKLQIATDYPPYQAALLALEIVGEKNPDLKRKLETYASEILQGVQQSIDEGEYTFSIVNKHTMSVDPEKGIILTDTYSSVAVDDPGTDKVVLLDGKLERVEPDFSLMPDHIMYVTSIEELANTLLNDLSAASGAFSTSSGVYLASTGAAPSRSYSGSTAATYIRTYVAITHFTPYCYGILENHSNWNSSYPPHNCGDCTNYVSQALAYGGIPTTTEWQSESVAWLVVDDLVNYIISGDYGNYTSATYLLGLGDLGMTVDEDYDPDDPAHAEYFLHVVMVSALNPLRYSGHTNDRYNYPWQAVLSVGIDMH